MKLSRHLATGLGAAALALAIALATAAAWRSFGTAEAAPDVAYTRLDGSPARTGQLAGKVALVSFWATTCSVCLHEMPQLIATHRQFAGPGFETLAVAMSYDPPARVVHFAQSRQLPFTVVIDNLGTVAKAFGDVQLTPTLVVVDKRGRIVRRWVGAPDFAELQALITRLMNEA